MQAQPQSPAQQTAEISFSEIQPSLKALHNAVHLMTKNAIYAGLAEYRLSHKGVFARPLTDNAATQEAAKISFAKMQKEIVLLTRISSEEFAECLARNTGIFAQHADANRLAADIVMQIIADKFDLSTQHSRSNFHTVFMHPSFAGGPLGRQSSFQEILLRHWQTLNHAAPSVEKVKTTLSNAIAPHLSEALTAEMQRIDESSTHIAAYRALLQLQKEAEIAVRKNLHDLFILDDKAADKFYHREPTPEEIKTAKEYASEMYREAMDYNQNSFDSSSCERDKIRQLTRVKIPGDQTAKAEIPAAKARLAASQAELSAKKAEVQRAFTALPALEQAVINNEPNTVFTHLADADRQRIMTSVNARIATIVTNTKTHFARQAQAIEEQLAPKEAAVEPELAAKRPTAHTPAAASAPSQLLVAETEAAKGASFSPAVVPMGAAPNIAGPLLTTNEIDEDPMPQSALNPAFRTAQVLPMGSGAATALHQATANSTDATMQPLPEFPAVPAGPVVTEQDPSSEEERSAMPA